MEPHAMLRLIGPTPIRRISDLISTISDLFVVPPTAAQQLLAQQLRQELEAIGTDMGEALPFWKAAWENLLQEARSSDPRYFMRWPTIAGTMVNRTTPFSLDVYRRLRHARDWRTVWKPAISRPPFGHGPRFLPYFRTDANTVMHAGHLLHFAAITGRSWLDHDVIVEFGGGYGSMCRLVRRLGFKGRYVIFDLRPILALQRYYLALHGIAAGYDSAATNLLTTSLATVADSFGPRTAVMSTWALSEMPFPLRGEITALLTDPRCAAALFAYQRRFEGVDNTAWFRDLADSTAADFTWILTPIDDDSDYLVGQRRGGSGLLG
jgi:hypothetical protein